MALMRLADHAVDVGLRRIQRLLQANQAAALQLQQLGMNDRMPRCGQAQCKPRSFMKQRGKGAAIGMGDG